MEPRIRVKIVVGLFVFIGLLLFAASIFLLGERGRYFARQHRLHAFFTNVAGLHEGATVRLAGVAVGRVTRIRLPRPPEPKVLVELTVADEAIESVRRDSVARLGTMGVLGDKFLEVTVGDSREPRLSDGATLDVDESGDFGALVGQGQRMLGAVERLAAALEGGEGALPWLVNDRRSAGLAAETLAAIRTAAGAVGRLGASVESGQGRSRGCSTIRTASNWSSTRSARSGPPPPRRSGSPRRWSGAKEPCPG